MNHGMIYPKNRNRDSDSPTLVPDGRPVPPAAIDVQSHSPSSDTDAKSREQLASDAPTMVGATRPTSSLSDAHTVLDVRGSGGSPTREPVSGPWQLPTLMPGMVLG